MPFKHYIQRIEGKTAEVPEQYTIIKVAGLSMYKKEQTLSIAPLEEHGGCGVTLLKKLSTNTKHPQKKCCAP